MKYLQIILIALSLAMDAFAVSVASGTSLKKRSDALKMGIAFGFFQGIMPVIGYSLGVAVNTYIQSFDHWIAAGLLCFIGGKMIYNNIKGSSADGEESFTNPFALKNLLVLSVATSIDALAVGLSLSVMDVDIIFSAVIIGVITAALSTIGVFIGRLISGAFRRGAEIIGGVVLIIIGLKILLESIL